MSRDIFLCHSLLKSAAGIEWIGTKDAVTASCSVPGSPCNKMYQLK